MPRAQFEHEVTLQLSPHVVWEHLQRPETWAGLGPVERVWDPAWENGVLCSYRWSAQAGPRHITGEAHTRQAVAPRLMVIGFEASGFSGLLTTELVEVDEGTLAELVLSIETDNFLMSLVFGIVADTIRTHFPAQVESLAARIGG